MLLVAVVVLSGGGGVSGLPLEAPPTVFRNQLPFFHKDRWKKGHLFSKKDAQVQPHFLHIPPSCHARSVGSGLKRLPGEPQLVGGGGCQHGVANSMNRCGSGCHANGIMLDPRTLWKNAERERSAQIAEAHPPTTVGSSRGESPAREN